MSQNPQPVDGVEWPKGLEQLLFGRVFNQQIQGAVWASGLRLLALGDFFDQVRPLLCTGRQALQVRQR